jgi:MFS family permease
VKSLGSDAAISRPRVPAYAWVVFALTFGLLISDYMARQVLNAVFPLLKTEWGLTDGQLGFLAGVVPLMVGLLTLPVSMLADRFGRARSVVIMAVIWSAATLLCALANNYDQMLIARVLVGVGEAAYGSVGIAVIISVFPKHMRGTLTAAFMAGGLAGQVLGVGIGGAIAATHGWRMAFNAIGIAGLMLAAAYAWWVRDSRLSNSQAAERPRLTLENLKTLFAGRTLTCAYVASGLQLFVAGALPAWLPTYFVRYYELPLQKAAPLAAIFLAIGGVGMVLCGMASDRFVQGADRRARLSAGFCLISAILVAAAFAVGPGVPQLVLLGLAMFFAASTAGAAGAIVAALTPAALHGTAFAVLTLANNVFGLAPGPILTGWLADRVGLIGALQMLPIASIAAAMVFFLASRGPAAELSPGAVYPA